MWVKVSRLESAIKNLNQDSIELVKSGAFSITLEGLASFIQPAVH